MIFVLCSCRGSEGLFLQIRWGEGEHGDARSGYEALKVRHQHCIWVKTSQNLFIPFFISSSFLLFLSTGASGLSRLPTRPVWTKFWLKPDTSSTPKRWAFTSTLCWLLLGICDKTRYHFTIPEDVFLLYGTQ